VGLDVEKGGIAGVYRNVAVGGGGSSHWVGSPLGG
jgi:hypothetical protein